MAPAPAWPLPLLTARERAYAQYIERGDRPRAAFVALTLRREHVVKLAGSVEIAPGLGLADCIVDVVETGRTLAENGLVAVDEVAESSARLVVNRASFHARRPEVMRLIEALRRAAA